MHRAYGSRTRDPPSAGGAPSTRSYNIHPLTDYSPSYIATRILRPQILLYSPFPQGKGRDPPVPLIPTGKIKKFSPEHPSKHVFDHRTSIHRQKSRFSYGFCKNLPPKALLQQNPPTRNPAFPLFPLSYCSDTYINTCLFCRKTTSRQIARLLPRAACSTALQNDDLLPLRRLVI